MFVAGLIFSILSALLHIFIFYIIKIEIYFSV